MPRKKSTRSANGEGDQPVKLPDGRWRTRVSYRKADGTRARKVIYGRTQQECVRNKQVFQARLSSGIPVSDNDKATVARYVELWLDNQHAMGEGTKAGHRSHLRKHISTNRIGRMAIGEVQPGDVRAFVTHLLGQGKAGGTVRRIVGLVGSALRTAAGDGVIPRNPVSLVRLPPPGKPKLDTFTPRQVARLWASIRNHPHYALYVLAPTLGCRQGELLALRWSSVVFDGADPHIKIQETVKRVTGKGLVFGPPKTEASNRMIPLDAEQVAILRAHRSRQNEIRLLAGARWVDNDLVFCTANARHPISFGAPLDARNILREWRQILAGAGLPYIRFHALRHTAFTELAAADVNPETIRQIAGHSDVRITLSWYTHPTHEMKREALRRQANRYGSALNPADPDPGAAEPADAASGEAG